MFSGIQFYDEVGYIAAGANDSEYLLKYKKCVDDLKINAKYLRNNDLAGHFPFLNFSENDAAIYEENNSGYIRPMRLIEAHISLAKQNGCETIKEVARSVKKSVLDGRNVMCVTMDSGRQIFAEKVLLSTGAFTAFRDLLPVQLKVDVRLFPLTYARVEISIEDHEKIRYLHRIKH